MIIGYALGFIIAFGFILISKSLTLKIYEYFGIVRPLCLDNISCASSAIFDISLYFIAITGVVCLTLGIGMFMRKCFNEAAKEKCKFCSKELGEEYYNGNTMYNLKNDNLWAHKKCVPNNILSLWKLTE